MSEKAISPPHQRQFDRGSWVALGIVLIMVVASIGSTIASLTSVGDGCVFDGGNDETTIFGTCVGGWATPLRAGDELLAVGRTAWRDRNELAPRTIPVGWVENGVMPYTVRRAGHTLDFDVPLHRMGWDGILRAFGYGFTRQADDWNTFAFLSMIVIFALAPRARAAQLLLVAIGGVTAVTTLAWPGDSVGTEFTSAPVWILNSFISWSWGWLFAPTILLLVLSFPRRAWPLARWPQRTIVVLYALPLASVVCAFSSSNNVVAIGMLGLYTLLIVIATVAITVHTFRKVRDPVVRAQTAWLAFGLAFGLGFQLILWLSLIGIPGFAEVLETLPSPWWSAWLIEAATTLAFPMCLGIAITRYRLFDIDVIIRRTLVYTVLTLTLGLVYLGCILLSHVLIAPVIGSSDLAIVVSTLAIAALFLPLRRSIQTIIDKHFYRRKYDAAKILMGFGATARDETDLERLTGELVHVVDEAMQPEFVGLWLRDRETSNSPKSSLPSSRNTPS
jgi:hypothetical protein